MYDFNQPKVKLYDEYKNKYCESFCLLERLNVFSKELNLYILELQQLNRQLLLIDHD